MLVERRIGSPISLGEVVMGRRSHGYHWCAWTPIVAVLVAACGSGGGPTPPPPPANAPAARWLASMVYDAAHSQIIMFGGSNGAPASGVPSFFNDLWSWNGSAWSQISFGAGPPARDGAGIAYGGNRQRVVLFGGRGV